MDEIETRDALEKAKALLDKANKHIQDGKDLLHSMQRHNEHLLAENGRLRVLLEDERDCHEAWKKETFALAQKKFMGDETAGSVLEWLEQHTNGENNKGD